jgi:DUF1009 family protein
MIGGLGIIAGKGLLPKLVAETHSSKGGQVFVAKITEGSEGCYDQYNQKAFALGEVGSLFEYFRSNNVTDIVMIGGMTRPKLAGIRVDKTGALLLARVVKAMIFGDDKLLRIVAQFFEESGFKILSATSILSGEATISTGVATKITPSDSDYIDIEIGIKAAKELGKKDLGQAVIVSGGLVTGSEDERGTDYLIKSHNGGILVKAMKPMQDERLDIPAIGVDTIENASANGLRGIAIEANKVIVVDRWHAVQRANELGIFLVGV